MQTILTSPSLRPLPFCRATFCWAAFRLLLLLTSLCWLPPYALQAQSFTDIVANLPGVYLSSVAWGDYDNDGDLDVLLTGTTNGSYSGGISRIYRNDQGSFTDINANLPGVLLSSVAWGDYDNDGDLDILLTGNTNGRSSGGGISRIYRNDRGSFTDINAGLPGVYASSVAWGDYDNDGDLDVLLTGTPDGNGAITQIYRNNQGSFTDINAGLPGVYLSSVAWGDYDNDGDLDVLLTGTPDGNGAITQIYRNNQGSFTDINANLPGVYASSVAWGDYDNDGDLDVLLTGTTNVNSSSGGISRIYRNDQGSFTDINANLPGVSYSSVAWGDYDNDGDLDFLLTGTTDGSYSGGISRIYRNDQGSFTDINANLPGVSYSSVAWGDYDNDGDLDFLLTGTTNGSFSGVTRIYRNDQGSFTDIEAGLPGVFQSSVAWGDYDNDGDLDFLLTGTTNGSFSGVTQIYRNQGSFTDIEAGLPGVFQSSVAWGDYDNDGDLDFLLTGTTDGSYSGGISRIYRNDQGSFTDINANLPGVYQSSVAWGDYDNDGDLDILLSGYSSSGLISRIYRNDQGSFTDINAGLPGVYQSLVSWGDYDNDGDLDFLLTGTTNGSFSGVISRIYRNDQGSFTDINAGLPGVAGSSVAWATTTTTATWISC